MTKANALAIHLKANVQKVTPNAVLLGRKQFRWITENKEPAIGDFDEEARTFCGISYVLSDEENRFALLFDLINDWEK